MSILSAEHGAPPRCMGARSPLAAPGKCEMKRLGALEQRNDGMAVSSRGYSASNFTGSAGCVMDGCFAMGICRHGQALPLHPRIEHPQDEVKDAIIAQFALRTAPGHREVR